MCCCTGVSFEHARRGAESLLSDCSVMRWLPYHSAAANTVARVGELMALRGCKRSSRQRGPHGAPSDTARGSMRESAAACDYLAAADEGVPSQGIGGRTPCRVASNSPHVTRRCVQVLRGPHCKSLQEVLTRGCRCHTLPSQSPLTVASLKCSQTTRYIRPTITTTCAQRNLASQTPVSRVREGLPLRIGQE